MPLYNINGKEVNLPAHFENKTPQDQKAYIDNLVSQHTDQSGNFNPPANLDVKPGHHLQGAELGILTQAVQDIGGGVSHKALNIINNWASKQGNNVPGEAAIKDQLGGTPNWGASRADIHNLEQQMKIIADQHKAMPPEEAAKWEISIEKPELVPKGSNAKIIADRAAAKAAEESAKAEARRKASQSVMGKIAESVPLAAKAAPYLGRALSGAQLLEGAERLSQPGLRNKISGGMNVLGGALPIAAEFFPPLEGAAIPLSMALGAGSEFVAPSPDERAPNVSVGKPVISQKAGGLTHLYRK